MRSIKEMDKRLDEREQEIERLNNVIDKKEQFLGNNIKRLEREVVKRDNIINELEKWLEEQLMYFNENNAQGGFSTNLEDLEIVKDKLQELKGSDNNE